LTIDEAQLNMIVKENEFFMNLYRSINELITPQGLIYSDF